MYSVYYVIHSIVFGTGAPDANGRRTRPAGRNVFPRPSPPPPQPGRDDVYGGIHCSILERAEKQPYLHFHSSTYMCAFALKECPFPDLPHTHHHHQVLRKCGPRCQRQLCQRHGVHMGVRRRDHRLLGHIHLQRGRLVSCRPSQVHKQYVFS